MKMHYVVPVLLGIIVPTMTLPVRAEDHRDAVKAQIGLPEGKFDGQCKRKVLMKDATGTKELFATEICPEIDSANLTITPGQATDQAGKGCLDISYSCTISIHDYYAGKPKKTLKRSGKGCLTADYVYALDELSLKNIRVVGSQTCAQPVKQLLKKFR